MKTWLLGLGIILAGCGGGGNDPSTQSQPAIVSVVGTSQNPSPQPAQPTVPSKVKSLRSLPMITTSLYVGVHDEMVSGYHGVSYSHNLGPMVLAIDNDNGNMNASYSYASAGLSDCPAQSTRGPVQITGTISNGAVTGQTASGSQIIGQFENGEYNLQEMVIQPQTEDARCADNLQGALSWSYPYTRNIKLWPIGNRSPANFSLVVSGTNISWTMPQSTRDRLNEMGLLGQEQWAYWSLGIYDLETKQILQIPVDSTWLATMTEPSGMMLLPVEQPAIDVGPVMVAGHRYAIWLDSYYPNMGSLDAPKDQTSMIVQAQ